MLGDGMFYRFSNVLFFLISELYTVVPFGAWLPPDMGFKSKWAKAMVIWGKGYVWQMIK